MEIKRTLGFVASVKFPKPPRFAGPRGQESGWVVDRVGDDPRIRHGARPARDCSPPGFLKTVIMPDGRVTQISAGNPND
jgi:hypothetical protein